MPWSEALPTAYRYDDAPSGRGRRRGARSYACASTCGVDAGGRGQGRRHWRTQVLVQHLQAPQAEETREKESRARVYYYCSSTGTLGGRCSPPGRLVFHGLIRGCRFARRGPRRCPAARVRAPSSAHGVLSLLCTQSGCVPRRLPRFRCGRPPNRRTSKTRSNPAILFDILNITEQQFGVILW